MPTQSLGDSSSTALAEELLRRIVSGERIDSTDRPLRTSRRHLVAVVAAVTVVAVVPVMVRDAAPVPGEGYAATPDLLDYHPSGAPAGELLRDIAMRIQHRQAEPGTGPYRYSKIQTWRLGPSVDARSRTMATALTSELVETWVRPDGTGRVARTGGPAEPQGPAQPLPPDNTVIELTRQQPAQGDAPRTDLTPPADLAALSTDPNVLGGQLDAMPPPPRVATGGSPGWFGRYVRIRAIWTEQPVPPALQAAFLRVLATTPGLTDQGEVSDRVGRRAQAFSADVVDGPQTVRHVFLLDPATGMPTGFEELLLTAPAQRWGDASVQLPAVVGYVAVLATALVPTDRSTP